MADIKNVMPTLGPTICEKDISQILSYEVSLFSVMFPLVHPLKSRDVLGLLWNDLDCNALLASSLSDSVKLNVVNDAAKFC
jgi:hypothetical protein